MDNNQLHVQLELASYLKLAVVAVTEFMNNRHQGAEPSPLYI